MYKFTKRYESTNNAVDFDFICRFVVNLLFRTFFIRTLLDPFLLD